MKKHLYLVTLLSFLFTVTLTAQNDNQLKTDHLTQKTLFKDLQGSYGGAVNSNFRGAVIFDDRLLQNGLKSISLLPVDTAKTITYIRPEKVTKSLIDIDQDCQYGILILSTSLTTPTILSDSVLLSNVEQLILNSKKILYKNESGEPD